MYGNALRKQVLKLIETGKSQTEVSIFLNISLRTIQRWVHAVRTGQPLRAAGPIPRQRKLDKEALKSYVATHQDATLKELESVFKVHYTAIWRHLKNFGITLKKSHSL